MASAEVAAGVCAACGAGNPEAARFCAACGVSLGSLDRARSYAPNPSESVVSVSVVSTVMPYASARAPQTYRLALAAGLAVPVVAALFGALPFALVTAAFVVPVVFVVYLYDVNLWDDAPVPVVAATFVLGGALGLAFTWAWTTWMSATAAISVNRLGGVFDLRQFLVPCVVVPVVAVVLMLLGPLYLASRPKFDDLMDGLTFGVVSAVAYAAFETLVVNWPLVRGGLDAAPDAAVWMSVIVNAALLKPLVYGCAVGIAAAQFSGLGAGYDGFGRAFAARVAEAMAALVLFQAGLYLTGLVTGTTGLLLGMLWAGLVAAALILRVRTTLQRGLLEGALESAAGGATGRRVADPDDFCAECEMPLLEAAAFCVACGASVRARPKSGRATASAPVEGSS